MKKITVEKFCDRCGKPIKEGLDDMVLDQIERDYPNKDLCENCYGIVELSAALAKQDAIDNSPPGTTLKKMVELYNEPHHIFQDFSSRRSNP